ncbi:phytoene desaturase family protein [Candidatus Margulisiibacteriota bacterium]
MFKGISPNQLKDKYDVIVIGSGLGGLVCANYLAKAGKSVLVIEQHLKPGGYCTSFKRKDYTFDAAVRLIGSCGNYELIGLALRGIDVNINFIKRNPLPLFFEQEKIEIPFEMEKLKDQLKPIAQDDNLDKIFLDLKKSWRQIQKNNPADSGFVRLSGISFKEYISGIVKSGRLADVFSSYSPIIGGDASLLSAQAVLGLVGSYLLDGTYQIAGGAQNLSDLLTESLQNKGGSIIFSSLVNKIAISEGAVSGIEIGKKRVGCSNVVSGVDALQTFFSMLGKQYLDQEFIDRIKSMKTGRDIFTMYLGIKNSKIIEDFEGYYFSNWNIAEQDKFIMTLEVPSKLDRSICQGNDSIAIVSCYIPKNLDKIKDWKKKGEEIKNKLLLRLEKMIPEIREQVEVIEYATPETYYKYTLNHNGSAFGWDHIPGQTGPDRLANQTPIKGLYLTGHWTQPGGGSMNAILSGRMTSSMILKCLKE